jgi:hypothetical protein
MIFLKLKIDNFYMFKDKPIFAIISGLLACKFFNLLIFNCCHRFLGNVKTCVLQNEKPFTIVIVYPLLRIYQVISEVEFSLLNGII